MGRQILKTEDPSGSLITIDTMTDDCGANDRRQIRAWSATHEYLGRWCFACKRWHHA